jgi:hypothetical protein
MRRCHVTDKTRGRVVQPLIAAGGKSLPWTAKALPGADGGAFLLDEKVATALMQIEPAAKRAAGGRALLSFYRSLYDLARETDDKASDQAVLRAAF